MKKPNNIQEFLDRVQQISANEGKHLKFSDISKDLESTYSHIITQKETLNSTISNFKEMVFKIEILKKIRAMTGEDQEKNLNYQVAGVGQEPRGGLLQENLMSLRISYIGGVIPSD